MYYVMYGTSHGDGSQLEFSDFNEFDFYIVDGQLGFSDTTAMQHAPLSQIIHSLFLENISEFVC